MLQIANHTKPTKPSEALDAKKLEFGKMFTPNFFIMEYKSGEWRNPRIEPLRPFTLHPAAVVFHYAQTAFEGIKAFRQESGRIVVFRPEMNARRFRQSANRLSIPEIDEGFFVEAVQSLVQNERYFVPDAPGCMYIRPAVMGVEATLGVKSANEFIFFILTLPSGPYFKGAGEGPGSIDVLVSRSVFRACTGGMGNVKAGANYAGTLKITEQGKKLGCSQVLFLDAKQHRYVEEMGGMNIMFVQSGRLRTPPLTDTILAGVTRESLLVLAREAGLETNEVDPLTLDEVLAGIRDGSVTEAMACGTAAVVTGIKGFRFEDGSSLQLPGAGPGPVTTQLYETLVGIQYGRLADRHGWIREICSAEQTETVHQSIGR